MPSGSHHMNRHRADSSPEAPSIPRTSSSVGSTTRLARSPARHTGLEELESGRAEQLAVQGDGRKWRLEHTREVHVVEPHDREIFRYPNPALAGREVQPRGDHVVVAEHAGGLGVEQRPCGFARVVDPDRGEDARLIVGIEAGGGEHSPPARFAQVEGEGVERGGQVSDPPVAELERCSNAAAAPASASKRTDGRPRSSASTITTISSGPSASGAVTSKSR